MAVEQLERPDRQAREVPQVGIKPSQVRLSQIKPTEDVFSWLAFLSFLIWLSHSHAARNALQSAERLVAKFLLHG